MKTQRFIGNFNLNNADLKVNDAELLNQLKNVLRLGLGDEVILCDGKLNEAIAKISEIGKDFISFRIIGISKNKNEPDGDDSLYCSILKRENFELVVQKAVEAGIKEIVPIVSERTVKLDIRKDRLEKIIKEAAEQSGRGILPELQNTTKLQEAVKNSEGNKINIFFDISGDIIRPSMLNTGYKDNVGVWVGPEGGWTPEELELARNSGFKIISLGKLTLRAETAAIVGTYLAIHNL